MRLVLASPHHVSNERSLIEQLRLAAEHGAPIPHHDHIVADCKNLVEKMADVDDRHAFGLQPAHDVEKPRALSGRQGRCRFVEDQNLRVPAKRPRDFHQLTIAEAEIADHRRGIDIGAEALEKLAGAAKAFRIIDPAEPLWKRVDENVLADRHGRQRIELLLDKADPGLQGFNRRSQRNRQSSNDDLAGVPINDAAEDVHQGRLAGSIRADERRHSAGSSREIGVVEREHPGEGLADRLHMEGRTVDLTLPSMKSDRTR